MQKGDFEGIVARGAAARQAGASFYENPFYFSTVPTDTAEQFHAWTALCSAWSAGWVREDAGRDHHITPMLYRPLWF